MTSRNVFVPEPGEVFIGVIRPSLWTLVWPLAVSALLILFPFIFIFALLGLGGLGITIAVLSMLAGLFRLRRIRRDWLLGSLFVTDRRIADLVSVGRTPTFVSILWTEVTSIETKQSLFARLFGLGTLEIHAKDNGISLIVPSVNNPVAIQEFLHEVEYSAKL